MTLEANREAMLGYISSTCSGGDFASLGRYIHDDVALPPDMPEGRQGLGGLQEHLIFMTGVFDYRYTVEHLIAENDLVAARFIISGKQLGEFMDLSFLGREFTIEEWNIARFRDGKISQIWRIADFHGLLKQLAAEA